jgi:hypothetical protein
MQPVYVGDVARAVADAVDGKTKPGATYELGGPEVLTMREIMEIILVITGRQRMLISLPFGLAKLQAMFLQFAPGALKLTPDQVALLRSDNVLSDGAKAAGLTLEGLGITPDSLEAIARNSALPRRQVSGRARSRRLPSQRQRSGASTMTRHHAKTKPWRVRQKRLHHDHRGNEGIPRSDRDDAKRSVVIAAVLKS